MVKAGVAKTVEYNRRGFLVSQRYFASLTTPRISLSRSVSVLLPWLKKPRMAQSKATMETSAEIRKRFGDEQSNLLDQFERMSFEAHLNRAMLGRSLSEPGLSRLSILQPLLTHQVNQGRRRRPPRRASAAFHKLLNKLFKPILRRNTKPEPPPSPPQHPLSCKTFSTSLRF